MRIGAAIAAIVLAAVAADLAYFLPFIVLMIVSGSHVGPIADMMPLLLTGLVAAAIGVTVIGLPVGLLVAWMLRRAGAERGWTYAVAGVVGGLLLTIPFGVAFEFGLPGMTAGLILGLAWWRFVRGPQLRAAAHV